MCYIISHKYGINMFFGQVILLSVLQMPLHWLRLMHEIMYYSHVYLTIMFNDMPVRFTAAESSAWWEDKRSITDQLLTWKLCAEDNLLEKIIQERKKKPWSFGTWGGSTVSFFKMSEEWKNACHHFSRAPRVTSLDYVSKANNISFRMLGEKKTSQLMIVFDKWLHRLMSRNHVHVVTA